MCVKLGCEGSVCNLNLNFVWEDVRMCKRCVRVCKCVCKSVLFWVKGIHPGKIY